MKKVLLINVMCYFLMINHQVYAQEKIENKIGVVLGLGLGNLIPQQQNAAFGKKFDPGFCLNIGGYYSFFINKKLAVEPGLGFIATSWTENFTVGTAGAQVGYDVKNTYFNAPITIQYYWDKFRMGIGPEFNYLFRTKSERYSISDFNDFDYGLTTNFDYKFSYFKVGLCYKQGFAKIFNPSTNIVEKKGQSQNVLLTFRYEL